MSKKEAKNRIKKLIEKYDRLSEFEKQDKNEMTTRKDFVLRLFDALGWDVYNSYVSNEVIEEDPVVKGTVDYTFRLNNIPQFLLEAKALKINLDKSEWTDQAITYAWNMGIDWVILTNFEKLKLFNAEEKADVPRPILEFTYKDYLNKFDDLWLLSKESFQNGEFEKETGRFNIGIKRVEVTERLAKDLVEWREEIFRNFLIWNEDKKSEEEIDEAVQRILDRFIFIRSCEDRKIEPIILRPAFEKWHQERGNDNFVKTLKPVFKKFDEKYNSNLFVPHFCEELETDGTPFSKVINGLYGDKESGVKYNFAAIKPDVLGAVYEQYLGHLLEKAKKGKVAKEKAKRKKQGIYYTPTFIVDYIIQNTISRAIEDKKNLGEIQNLKVLDPACGSGSFLIKAFDVLDKALKELRSGRTSTDHAHRKYRILTGNIYGVDLDEQAIEITRLNLLLKAIEPGHKLPLLSDNTKVGNSLISGTEKELKKYFGKNWKEKKPFNWEEEFPEVFKGKNLGFDVIVGNPPYVDVRKIGTIDKKYLFNKMDTISNRTNTFALFIEQGIKLLNEGGYLGFIVPNTLLTHSSYKKLRKYILDNCVIKEIVNLGGRIFQQATVETIIIIVQRISDGNIRKENKIEIINNVENLFDRHTKPSLLIQNDFILARDYIFNLTTNIKISSLLKKMELNTLPFDNLFKSFNGINPGNQKDKLVIREKLNNNYRKVIDGKNIYHYGIKWGGDYILYDRNKLERPRKEEIFLMRPKLMMQKIGTGLVVGYDDEQLYALINTTILLPREKKYSPKYILALLNSKLLNFYYKNIFVGVQIKDEFLDKLPIRKIDFLDKKEKSKHDELVRLADRMLKLNKELQKTTEKSDKWYEIKKEIEKTDKIIDQKVYKLYGLTPEEIRVVEGI